MGEIVHIKEIKLKTTVNSEKELTDRKIFEWLINTTYVYEYKATFDSTTYDWLNDGAFIRNNVFPAFQKLAKTNPQILKNCMNNENFKIIIRFKEDSSEPAKGTIPDLSGAPIIFVTIDKSWDHEKIFSKLYKTVIKINNNNFKKPEYTQKELDKEIALFNKKNLLKKLEKNRRFFSNSTGFVIL